MERLRTSAELAERCRDPLLWWAAQDMGGSIEAWAHGGAVAVAAAGLARRDRVAVTGPVADIAQIVRALADRPEPRYRPLGDEQTISQLCEVVPGLTITTPFGWMTTSRPPAAVPAGVRLCRADEHAQIDQILAEVLPGSLARPGLPGVGRWWVAADAAGVAACAADAWSAPGVGLLAGVATARRAQCRGLGRAVTAAALTALVAEHGLAALMVDAGNTAARALYASLGMTYRAMRAAAPGAAG